MTGRILVAYATRAGSTEGIAEVIAEGLRLAGYDAGKARICDAPDPKEYDRIILGGPIYMGSMNEVQRYCQEHEDALQSRIIGVFAVGMSFAGDDEEKHAQARDVLKKAIGQLTPRFSGYFAGMTNPEKLSFFQRTALTVVRTPIGDYRDWKAIKGWTEEIAEYLRRT
ncbi:MAG: flavodoxin domain-containing protein [Methanocalculus sp.]|uniref:flavodoxin domain-containing protein n=1 Tax=Methanocalculus sp. TaxID=2004547 RepID=UPI0027217D13|nr:flavodoxin domain-containing protein [Methanocalculus sp.]MDO9538929.1 flavodoxin domain-containing protein [Methanocalculus sp.]